MPYLERVRTGWENAFRDIRVRVKTSFGKDYGYDYGNVAKKRRLVAGALKVLDVVATPFRPEGTLLERARIKIATGVSSPRTTQEALEIINQHGFGSMPLLETFDASLRKNKAVALAAISKSGYEWFHLNRKMRLNRDVFLAAVASHCPDITKEDQTFNSDYEIMLAAVRHDYNAFFYASATLQSNEKFRVDCLSVSPRLSIALVTQKLGWRLYEDLRYEMDRDLSKYLGVLPAIPSEYSKKNADMNLLTFLEMRLRDILSNEDGGKIRVLDVGCGNGNALIEMFEKLASAVFDWRDRDKLKEHVELVGISLDDFRGISQDDRLEEYGIKYIVDDARNSSQIFKDQKFDCIISTYALSYIGWTERSDVLAQIYNLLRPCGVALLQSALQDLKDGKMSSSFSDKFLQRPEFSWLSGQLDASQAKLDSNTGNLVLHKVE